MKSLFLFTALVTFISLLGCGQDAPSSDSAQRNTEAKAGDTDGPALSSTPLDVVNRRMSAYNRHDLPAFLKTYSDGVEIFRYPDKSLGKGKKHIRKLFEPMFKEGVVHVEVHHQITKDSYVVNHETVTYGDSKTEYVSIYEIRNGLIETVRFVRD